MAQNRRGEAPASQEDLDGTELHFGEPTQMTNICGLHAMPHLGDNARLQKRTRDDSSKLWD